MTITTEAPMKSTPAIETSKAPSRLPVGATPDSDWVLRRRRGNKVRYQNTRTAAWDRWMTLEPGDELYREPMKVVESLIEDEEPRTDAAVRIEDAQPEQTVDPVDYEENDGIVCLLTDEDDWESLTRDELRKIASERNIAGRGSMNKAQLIEALRNS